ncbi:MAG: HD domain-containing protein [Flavobacteriales bacterium]|nr:HD domain-containing protein [Flavobacteriales bacterium]
MASKYKNKIFNDPVYGFISTPYDSILKIIDHPYFQRLRRIKQLGLTHMVYPGALHTRFHHAMGCTHLMRQAIETLRSNGHEITENEAEGVILAILLHDIGHGPFSHALEHSIVKGMHHEELSLVFMNELNIEFNGILDTAIAIFKNEYHKKFLHQLVSSQLDMDRLDYLKRDSFYTGVSEGVVSNQRIIKMLDIVNDELVIVEKGIYSIEKFIVARRLMYWQVYLHKTVISAEFMLVKVLERAKELAKQGVDLFCSPALKFFLYEEINKSDFEKKEVINAFASLDDFDILGAIKVWVHHPDKILSMLSDMIINRKLLKIKVAKVPFTEMDLLTEKKAFTDKTGMSIEESNYFVFSDYMENHAYNPTSDSINILYKDGQVLDITEASDNLNIQALTQTVRKYYLCYPSI